jgi:hypothetical protein
MGTNQQKPVIMDTREIAVSIEDFEKSDIPLIAVVPKRDIYLYGIKPFGVVLYVDGEGHYYEWNYLTPRRILPEMNVGDYDNDGDDELSIVLYVGSGTGFSVEELHIIELSEKRTLSETPSDGNGLIPWNPEYFKDNCYLREDYLNQIYKQVKLKSYQKAGTLMATIEVGNKSCTLSLKELQEIDDKIIVEGIDLESIVNFEANNNNITIQLVLGVMTKSYATPQFVGDVYADVKYKAGKFNVSNLRFKPNKD